MLIDANLLLYAYNTSSEHHEAAKRWLQEVLSQPEPIRLSWLTITRIPSHFDYATHLPSPADRQRSAYQRLRVAIFA